jgi:hypothetical protein
MKSLAAAVVFTVTALVMLGLFISALPPKQAALPVPHLAPTARLPAIAADVEQFTLKDGTRCVVVTRSSQSLSLACVFPSPTTP